MYISKIKLMYISIFLLIFMFFVGTIDRVFISISKADEEKNEFVNSKSQIGIGLINRNESIFIKTIIPNSPAELAGLKHGDEIKTINGKRVETIYQLKSIISTVNEGENVNLGILRGRQNKYFSVKINNTQYNYK